MFWLSGGVVAGSQAKKKKEKKSSTKHRCQNRPFFPEGRGGRGSDLSVSKTNPFAQTLHMQHGGGQTHEQRRKSQRHAEAPQEDDQENMKNEEGSVSNIQLAPRPNQITKLSTHFVLPTLSRRTRCDVQLTAQSPAALNNPNSTKGPPERGKKEQNLGRERGKKREMLAPTLREPTLSGSPPLRSPETPADPPPGAPPGAPRTP